MASRRSLGWLVTVAERAALEHAASLSLEPDLSPAEAWQTVSGHCGLTLDGLAQLVAKHFRLATADFESAEPTATKLVPGNLAQKYDVFPLRADYRQLVVATSDPADLEVEQALGFASGRQPIMEVAPPARVRDAIDAAYAPDKVVESLLSHVDTEVEGAVRVVEEIGPEAVTPEKADGAPVIKLTNLILRDAIGQKASDIHIQPGRGGGVVRFRVDGVLRTYMRMPMPALARVVSRIKVLGNMDIADRLRPQDGRARVRIGDRNYDLRISTIPTRTVEKAVIRVLDTEGVGGLDEVGLPPRELSTFRRLLTNRDGIVVVTGPTGSGKTTTMYGALRDLSTEDVNIMTVEDPVEYELPGLTQMQVENKQGVTFASALRAILRQDPDIIFVGEIRDQETAEVAVQASLTGHLVLATLHTNDALGAIRRLTDLGLDAASIVDTLRGAIAQRLARRVCPECSAPVEGALTDEEERLAEPFGVRPVVRAVGCDRCGRTGYRGRIPVIEVFTMTPAVEDLVLRGPTSLELADAARAGGMRTLREAGAELVRNGDTTLEEIERVLGDVGEDEPSTQAEPPVRRASRATRASLLRASRTVVPPSSVEASGFRVALVDDDGAYRTIARALLEKEGYCVTEATGGNEALELVRGEEDYDLMILDLTMPDMDGRDVLARIRAAPATAALPVIVMTATADVQTEIQLMEEGADDYIRKPIDPASFVVRVKATLRRAYA